jgi:DNA (cytosine-5)-methyltransferase 1
MTPQLTAISLYTGAGGLDFGFEAAGFGTAVAIECDPHCVDTLTESRPHWPVIADDIHRVETSSILATAGLTPGSADVLIGGPPCQPFSKSGFWATGEARRLDDPRSSTVEAYLRVLEEAQPRAFLMENVEGLGFSGKDEGLQFIRQRLEAINDRSHTNYRCRYQVLNAADFGVPQQRRRLFIVGARDGREFRFPGPTHGPRSDGPLFPSLVPHRTALDALHDLPENQDESLRPRGKWADLLPTIPEGENYLWHTERGGGEPLFGWRRRYWTFLLKLAKRLPSWTIQAQPGPATGPFHWANRRLSAIEMARLQTFPRNVIIAGEHADAQRQLGNAVPSLLAEVLANEVRAQLLDRPTRQKRATLEITADPSLPPPPERTQPVPRHYLKLRGAHEPHPGTGKGYSASARRPPALRTGAQEGQ